MRRGVFDYLSSSILRTAGQPRGTNDSRFRFERNPARDTLGSILSFSEPGAGSMVPAFSVGGHFHSHLRSTLRPIRETLPGRRGEAPQLDGRAKCLKTPLILQRVQENAEWPVREAPLASCLGSHFHFRLSTAGSTPRRLLPLLRFGLFFFFLVIWRHLSCVSL